MSWSENRDSFYAARDRYDREQERKLAKRQRESNSNRISQNSKNMQSMRSAFAKDGPKPAPKPKPKPAPPPKKEEPKGPSAGQQMAAAIAGRSGAWSGNDDSSNQVYGKTDQIQSQSSAASKPDAQGFLNQFKLNLTGK